MASLLVRVPPPLSQTMGHEVWPWKWKVKREHDSKKESKIHQLSVGKLLTPVCLVHSFIYSVCHLVMKHLMIFLAKKYVDLEKNIYTYTSH